MKTQFPYSPEMPVSAKFYKRLIERIHTIIISLCLPDSDQIENETLGLIHRYLSTSTSDTTCTEISHIIYLTLRAEIDAAILRSRRARAAAASRRQARANEDSRLESLVDETSLKDTKNANEIENAANNLENTPLVNNTPASPSELSESSELSEKSEISELSAQYPPFREAHTRFGLKFRPASKIRRNRRAKYRKR